MKIFLRLDLAFSCRVKSTEKYSNEKLYESRHVKDGSVELRNEFLEKFMFVNFHD